MRARPDFLPFSPPAIGEEEIQEVIDTLRGQWHSTGPKTRRFEAAFAERFGSPAALALNSCTAGLHTALMTLGIGPGDEVITTAMTFCATANVIEHVGARTVLVDVERDTLNLDPSKIEAAITPRSRAIIPVHYAGHPAELRPIREIAARHGLQIIEDAAHAVPAKYEGQWIGQSGNPVAFSFYATKNLSTAEGGMLTGSPEFIDRARVISLHGMSRDAYKRFDKNGSWKYEVTLPGFKYNMTDIQASLGLVQLRRLEEMQARRRAIVRMYNDRLGRLDAFTLPVERPNVESAWHLYPIRLIPSAFQIDRDRFIEEMKARNIGVSVHYIPVHLHPYYSQKYGYKPQDLPVAFGEFENMLSIPLTASLKDQDVEDVIAAIEDIVRMHGR